VGTLFAIFLILSYFDAITVGWINNAFYGACLAAGALYACSDSMARFIANWATPIPILIAIAVILAPPFFNSMPIAFKLLEQLAPPLLAFVFFGTVKSNGRRMNSLLSKEWLVRTGHISYSLFLWQQLFVGKPEYYGGFSNLFIPLLIVPCAVLSYVLIEKPMNRVGRRSAARFRGQSPGQHEFA
jgi:peptidoglycan/LPS O-acetylase OafA/YrhL